MCSMSLQNFDNLLRDGVSSITNSSLSNTQRIQARSPSRNGGLGIRRGISLALSRTSKMCSSPHVDAFLIDTLLLPGWSELQLLVFPTLKKVMIKLNEFWDSITIMRDFNLVAKQALTVMDKARLLAVQSPHSSDWQHALSISSCGLRLDNEAVRVAVDLRLGLELRQPH